MGPRAAPRKPKLHARVRGCWPPHQQGFLLLAPHDDLTRRRSWRMPSTWRTWRSKPLSATARESSIAPTPTSGASCAHTSVFQMIVVNFTLPSLPSPSHRCPRPPIVALALPSLPSPSHRCPRPHASICSGVLDARALLARGVRLGLGTDVSGGYAPSMLDAIRQVTTKRLVDDR